MGTSNIAPFLIPAWDYVRKQQFYIKYVSKTEDTKMHHHEKKKF